jgi:hypothetical protein
MLSHYVERKQHNWDEYLPYILFAHRTHYREAINDTPLFLLYGYEPVLPEDLYLIRDDMLNDLATQQRNDVARKLAEARRLASEALQQQQQRYDKQRQRAARIYSEGDLVLCVKPYIPTGTTAKLATTYHGRYITDILDSGRTLGLKGLRDDTRGHTAGPHRQP